MECDLKYSDDDDDDDDNEEIEPITISTQEKTLNI